MSEKSIQFVGEYFQHHFDSCFADNVIVHTHS